MGAEHGGQGDAQAERKVEGVAVRLVEQGGLNAEQEGHEGGGGVQAHVRAERGGDSATGSAGRLPARQNTIDAVTDKGQRKSHREAVRAEREQAAIAEKKRLNRQRDRDADDGRPGAEQNREQRSRDRVRRRAAERGNVEHHHRETEGRAQ